MNDKNPKAKNLPFISPEFIIPKVIKEGPAIQKWSKLSAYEERISKRTGIMNTVKDHLTKTEVGYIEYENNVLFIGALDNESYEITLYVDEDNQKIFLFLEFKGIISADKRLMVAEFIVRINNMSPFGNFEMNIDEVYVRQQVGVSEFAP
jgi:hypothetical protein